MMSRVKKICLFVLPCLLWFFPFRNIFAGFLRILADSANNYTYTNYFLNNITRGVYPMWNPFYEWGRPDDFSPRMIGEFNPLIYVIALLNQVLGLSYSLSFFIYLLLCFFISLVGFYLIARRLLGDWRFDFLAVVLLMFSGIGLNLFNDILTILIFVPAVWFFYFLIMFDQTGRKIHLLGMVFTLMIIATTYLPFPFLTAFCSFVMFYVLIFYRRVRCHVNVYSKFIKDHPCLLAVCLLLLIASLVPGIFWYQAATSGEYVVAFRGDAVGPGHNPLNVSIESISRGGMVGQNSFRGLISNLGDLDFGNIFVPIFYFIILLTGFITPFNKRQVLCLAVSVFLFLISLANMTPLYPFLYRNVFFIKYFRNVHFLLSMYLPFFVLFLAEQMKNLLSYRPQGLYQKAGMLFYLWVLHLGFFIFVFKQPDVLISTFVVIGLSAVFFTCYFIGIIQREGMLVPVCLLILTAVQPLEVFFGICYKNRARKFAYSVSPYTKKESYPQFLFVRPPKATLPPKETFGFGDIRDTSGFMDRNFYGTLWSYLLQNNIAHADLEGYVRNKFYLYDGIEAIDPDNPDYEFIKKRLMSPTNIALVSLPKGQTIEAEYPKGQAEVLTRNSKDFEVLKFDLNEIRIKTNFLRKKFLVYNDSYHSHWRATLNGDPVQLYRANYAFKGLWLPAGENIVDMKFRAGFRHHFFLFLIVISNVLFIILVLAGLGVCFSPKRD